jgi:putative ABC transport system permease protein
MFPVFLLHFNLSPMFQDFFRIAVRNISRQKGFTFINVTGLAVGLAASLFILLWVQDELNYDKFNKNGRSIYRVEEDQFYSGERYHVTVTPHPGGPVWKQKIPEIKEQTRVNRLPKILFRQEDKLFFETAIVAADSGLFKMFTIPLLAGDPYTALASPNSIVLSEKLVKKYFGTSDPLGKSITLENKYQFNITGVMKDLPSNSSLVFDGVLPYSFLKQIGAIDDSWGNNSIFTYVQVEKGTNLKDIDKKLTDVVHENNPRVTTKFMLFPFLDIHLHSQFGYGENNGPVTTLYVFILIAICILLIACINYINLSTAKASTRGKEIGVKKVAGADKITIMLQFLFESFVLVTIALLLAILFDGLFLKVFNTISGKRFSLTELFHLNFIITILVVWLLAGFIAGGYPAFYLSSFKPVTVLKGESGYGKGNARLRKILVVFQFTLSILIAISTIFIYKQLKFLQEADLGFNKENLVCIPMAEGMKSRYSSLKNELLKETLIQGVTASRNNPVRMGSNSSGVSWDGKDPEKQVLIGTNTVDYDYLKTMKMELVSGRDFSIDFTSDIAKDSTGNFLVNEEVVKIMGIGDPVGKNFRFMGIKGIIVGVLKNFNFQSADQPIEPMAFALTNSNYLNYILIRLTPGDVPASLKSLERKWKEVIPEYPLEYTFIDSDYNNLFQGKMHKAQLLKYFTILSIIIACLGLYALSAYSTERRTNEIGIRKVMGAGSLRIMYTLSEEFVHLILISLALAIPIGWIIVKSLLKSSANRIDINPVVFVVVALVAVVVGMLTVGIQAYKATLVNPAEALKVE